MIHLDSQTQLEPNIANGVVVAEPIPTTPTLYDFGWMLCEPMDALKTVWRDYGWDLDIWRQELRPHLETCPRCELNRAAIDECRKWVKEVQNVLSKSELSSV